MAKKKTQQQTNSYDRRHLTNLRSYQKEIDDIFNEVTAEAAKIAAAARVSPDWTGTFYKDFPAAAKKVDALLTRMQRRVSVVITSGISAEWQLANEKNDDLVTQIFGTGIRSDLSDALRARYFAANADVMEAFLKRKEGGLDLSARVWNLTDKYKTELELGLETGLREGCTAAELSRDLRMYLNNPTALFRRVRNENGNLTLSRRAKAYHPGAGVYRSAYKNALRLTATEINMAYRTADHERWKGLDFVVGIHVGLSNNHTLNGHPFTDICDELAGDYPKGFKFVGWHPQCRCIATTILKTEEELKRDEDLILSGKDPGGPETSQNYIAEVPDGFAAWVEQNADRITAAESAGTAPYFIKDNEKTVEKIIQAASSPTAAEILTPPVFSETIKKLEQQGVDYLDVKNLKKSLSEAEIIKRVGGGDLTEGSCSSLAFAYAGNVCGFDVLDYRDGKSREVFASGSIIMNIAKQAGGVVVSHTNDFTKAKRLLPTVEAGKQYYFTCGRHAAVVRKSGDGLEYLELQSDFENGFKPLSDAELKRRFKAQKSHTFHKVKYETRDCIIDIELLKGSSDFRKLLGYINTLEQAQKKGSGGFIK